jgi:hypothetical protein
MAVPGGSPRGLDTVTFLYMKGTPPQSASVHFVWGGGSCLRGSGFDFGEHSVFLTKIHMFVAQPSLDKRARKILAETPIGEQSGSYSTFVE